jgi:hypothetical protein
MLSRKEEEIVGFAATNPATCLLTNLVWAWALFLFIQLGGPYG